MLLLATIDDAVLGPFAAPGDLRHRPGNRRHAGKRRPPQGLAAPDSALAVIAVVMSVAA
jgi:hypothetical protein